MFDNMNLDGNNSIDLNLSSYCTLYDVTDDNDNVSYMPISIYAKLKIDSEEEISDSTFGGALSLSFADIILQNVSDLEINTTKSQMPEYLGRIAFELDIAEFDGVTYSDINQIIDIISEIESQEQEKDYTSYWSEIKNILWDNDAPDSSLSLTYSVGDENGEIETIVYSGAEALKIIFPVSTKI